MKAESRGKYPGLKLHLDDNECKALLAGDFPKFKEKVTKIIQSELAEKPAMLEARTTAQVVQSLEKDQAKIVQQLAAIKGGKNWKKV